MKSGIVFDLDGTLVDSLPGIAAALNLALASMGKPTHTRQAIRSMVGKGARELCRAALNTREDEDSDDGIDDLLNGFMAEYPHTWQRGTLPYPGIEDLLDRLQEAGFPLAVLSNKPDVVTRPLVQEIFPRVRFDIVMGFSHQFPRKPDPASLLHIAACRQSLPENMTMVGDSKHDALAARQAGTRLVLVGWGYADLSDLEIFDAPICDTIEQLSCELVPQ